MTWVKVPDPNIIDLAAWQSLISTVNQHGDSLASILNEYSVGWTPTTEPDGGWKAIYDIGTQKIEYGKVKLSYASNLNASTQAGKYAYIEEVVFPAAFSETPAIIVSNSSSNTDGSTYASTWIVTTFDHSQTGFKVRLTASDNSELTGNWNILASWIAIGPN